MDVLREQDTVFKGGSQYKSMKVAPRCFLVYFWTHKAHYSPHYSSFWTGWMSSCPNGVFVKEVVLTAL